MRHSKFKKVIIWGYPLYSHTHSFVHYGWYKAFKHLGYDTYWFDDNNYPLDFDFNDCLFIAEGWADNKIPILSTSIYFVHVCRNPSKYLEKNCRLIDIRFNVRKTKDASYDYTRNDAELTNLDAFSFYESKANDLALNETYRKNISGYEAIYLLWATDLLPDEIKYDTAFLERTNTIHYVGSYWSANGKELQEFKDCVEAKGLIFDLRDPWKIKTTNEEAIEFIKKSYIAPDIRGTGATCNGVAANECNHLRTGYIPCRIFKNMSYGQLGISNSPAVQELMGDYIVYSEKISEILEKAEPYRNNRAKILDGMVYVKNNHTYLNRVANLMSIL